MKSYREKTSLPGKKESGLLCACEVDRFFITETPRLSSAVAFLQTAGVHAHNCGGSGILREVPTAVCPTPRSK